MENIDSFMYQENVIVDLDLHVFIKKEVIFGPNLHIFLQKENIFVKNITESRCF